MLLKGEGDNAESHRRRRGMDHARRTTPFRPKSSTSCSSNPPYGKSWKKDLEAMGGKDGMRDMRFKVQHAGEELVARYALQRRAAALPRQHGVEDERTSPRSAAASPKSTTDRRSLPATRVRARATSAAGSSRTTGSKPSSHCRSTSSTTPASPPTSGCCPTRSPRTARARCSSSTRRQWFKPLRKNLGKKNCELVARGYRAH